MLMAEDEKETGENEKVDPVEKRMDLIDHLDELRTRLIYCIVALVVVSVGSWWLVPTALKYLIASTGHVKYLGPADAFMWRIRLAGVLGAIVSGPFIIVQIWLFVRPGLKPNERRFAFPTISLAIILFYIGVIFGLNTVQITLRVLEKFGGDMLRPDYTVDRYLSFVGSFVLAFGVVFEVPVVLVLLAKLGIVSYQKLASSRRWAVLIAVVLGAIMTPTDGVTMFFVAVPLYVLFELSLLFIRFTTPRKKEEAA
jgi:sec-independent protein translocase protein TatC